LRQNPAEIDSLFQDMTIKVTRFFRDSKAFDALLKKGLQPLLRQKETGSVVRIWIPACATGEEAYSFAIMAIEASEALEKFFEFKIFATDINSDAVAAARRGYFPQSVAADISRERLNRFFSKKDHHYQVDSKIRDMIVFAVHDISRDPPFSNMDLISCRNLMIYMNSDLQSDILRILGYALNHGGILFMGTSETTGGAEIFTPVDKTYKIYRKQAAANGPRVQLHIPGALKSAGEKTYDSGRPPGAAARDQYKQTRRQVRDIVEQTILNKYAYPAVLIDDQGDILLKTSPQETLGQSIFRLGDDQWDIPELQRFLEEITPQIQTFENWEVEHGFPRIGHRKIAVNGRRIAGGERQPPMILLSFKELT
jgi:two-component system CheB/CheR fusion protein